MTAPALAPAAKIVAAPTAQAATIRTHRDPAANARLISLLLPEVLMQPAAALVQPEEGRS